MPRLQDGGGPNVKAFYALRSTALSLLSAKGRAQLWTRLRHGRNHFQGETTTHVDRYPALFSECRRLLSSVPVPAVLSFGCSTGEEVFSLASYLPNAVITGVDINAWCVRQAAQKNSNPKLRFLRRHSTEFKALDRLDAIFCMAVFQRTENRLNQRNTQARGFTFDRFETELQELDQKLKPGGLLFLDQCDFLFSETTLASCYTPIRNPDTQRTRQRPVFGRDNRLVATEYLADRCFQKHPGIAAARPEATMP